MEPSHVPFIDLEPWVEKVSGDFNSSNRFGIDVTRLLLSREFLGGGPTTKKLEARLSEKLGVPHVVTCANGTDALQLALRACGIDRGSRVAMPNLTFWATYEAIVNVGATPVLIDIDPDDRQMSFDDFKRAHDEKRFDAAILVHLYGWCSSRLTEFRTFCRERRITLIEDGAQAFGVELDGQNVFADADVATLSFHPAKVLGALGDGGAVLTKTARVAERVRALGNHGRAGSGQHTHVAVGWNSRLDAIQAVWLLRGLDVIDEVIEARRKLRDLYVTWLAAITYDYNPAHHVRSPAYPGITTNGYMTTLVRTNQPPADIVIRRLAEQSIEARRIYPYTIADQSQGNAIQYGPLYHSRKLAENIISLPLYYGMPEEYVECCVQAYVEAVK
jgi:UDP-2-acetamido-2-deoxy-ribo-hexuluronate aminotransferase